MSLVQSASRGFGTEKHGLPELAASQADCDAILADVRRERQRPSLLRPVPAAPAPLLPSDDVVDCRLAEEVAYAQRLLEAVGDCFISDPLILQRHQTTMQSFDIIGQLLGHLAAVMGAKDKLAAIDRVGMHELRARLKRPVPAGEATGTIDGV